MKSSMRSRAVRWLVVAAMCALPVQGFGYNTTVSPNAVVSNSIKPADGTTGQDVLNGSGVKTGHIQDGAVTAAKLGIVCPDGQYLQYTSTGGWVCSAGTAGPQGPQGPQGVVGPQGPKGDTGPQGAAAKYANVTVVAKSGGDYTDPITAMNDLATWCGTPSAANPCLMKIMPGIYDLGANTLFLNSFVDIDGSGENNTIIQGIGTSTEYPGRLNLVYGPYYKSNYQLSNLTINNYGDNVQRPVALFMSDPNVKLINVTVHAGGITDVTTGIWAQGGYFNNVTVNVDPAQTQWAIIYQPQSYAGSNLLVQNSRLNSGRLYNGGGVNFTFGLVNSLYNGWLESTVKMINVFDSNFTPR